MEIEIRITLRVEDGEPKHIAGFEQLVREAVAGELDAAQVDAMDDPPPYAEIISVKAADNLQALMVEWDQWCRDEGLENGSADEVLLLALSQEQRLYATRFIERWDAAIERDQEAVSDSHIRAQSVEHGGGNVYSDVLQLVDGKWLVISPDVVILYPSRAAMDDESEDPWAFPRIERHDEQSCAVDVCPRCAPKDRASRDMPQSYSCRSCGHREEA